MAKLLINPKFRWFDDNGEPLAGGKVYTYVAGSVNTPKASYTDNTESTQNSNPVILDGDGYADIWISGSYKIVITDANDVVLITTDVVNNDTGATGPSGTLQMATAGGTADAIVATYNPVVTLTNLVTVGFVASATNATTTPTFSPDGLTAHTITKRGGQALIAGDILNLGAYFVTYNSANTRWELLNPSSINIGKQTLYIPAAAMQPRVSNGCAALAKTELTSTRPNIRSLDFDPASIEYCQFEVAFPKSWNDGTLTAQFIWSHPSTTSNFGVIWGIQGVAVSDGEAVNAVFGTGVDVTDTGGTTSYQYVTDETAAVTVAGTPADGDVVYMQVYRNATGGADNLAVDARLHGIRLFYTTSAGNDT